MNSIILNAPDTPETVVSMDRMGIIIFLVAYASKLEGSIAEVGTYKGGTAHYINAFSNGKPVFLFDTFDGIPMQAEIDKHPVGDFGDTTFEQVKKHFSSSGNVKVIQGTFPSSVNGQIKESDKFCFVHLDADQYESTMSGLNFFYNKMVSNGVIVFDDWGWLPGVDKAINEFFADKPEKPIQATPMQCFIIKN